MIWKEKLKELIGDLPKKRDLKIVFRHFEPAQSNDINRIRKEFKYITDDYIEFLSISNGMSLWMYELYGLNYFEKFFKRWSSVIHKLNVFPIGEDPNGDCIALDEKGRIINFDYTIEDISNCIILAESFSVFVGEVLMGEKFYTIYDTSYGENEWSNYLEEKGWLKK